MVIAVINITALLNAIQVATYAIEAATELAIELATDLFAANQLAVYNAAATPHAAPLVAVVADGGKIVVPLRS